MEEIKVEDQSKCFYCGSKQIRYGDSLHLWNIDYECGSSILGEIGLDEIYKYKECPNNK